MRPAETNMVRRFPGRVIAPKPGVRGPPVLIVLPSTCAFLPEPLGPWSSGTDYGYNRAIPVAPGR